MAQPARAQPCPPSSPPKPTPPHACSAVAVATDVQLAVGPSSIAGAPAESSELALTPVDDHPSATSLRWRGLVCLLLLAASTVFMTIAQYLHLKLTQLNTAEAIFVSWGVAFFEYLLQVPANRMGHARQGGPFSAPVLRVVAELFSLSAFAVFSAVVLGQPPTAKGGAGFALIFLGVAVAMGGREAAHRRKGQTAAAPGGAETEEAVLDA